MRGGGDTGKTNLEVFFISLCGAATGGGFWWDCEVPSSSCLKANIWVGGDILLWLMYAVVQERPSFLFHTRTRTHTHTHTRLPAAPVADCWLTTVKRGGFISVFVSFSAQCCNAAFLVTPWYHVSPDPQAADQPLICRCPVYLGKKKESWANHPLFSGRPPTSV